MTDSLPAIIDQPAGTELALPEHIVASAKDYRQEALAMRTRQAYADAWKQFTAWCMSVGRRSMPASPETVAAWATVLADGLDGRKPRAAKTVQLYVTAVIYMHTTQPDLPREYRLTTKDPEIKAALAGINRTKARTRLPRKASPLMANDLLRMLRGFNADRTADVRDAALLVLGWSGAARRSELVSLDWQELGTGDGFVRIVNDGENSGVEIVLMVSKASQDAAVSIAIPACDMPATKLWLEAWAAKADLKPGEPVFRPVDRIGRISNERMTGRSVSDILKKRVGAFYMAEGKSPEEVQEIVRRSSGHSLRRGFCSTASDRGIAIERTAGHSRHVSLDTLRGYIDNANKWKRSALKGIGF